MLYAAAFVCTFALGYACLSYAKPRERANAPVAERIKPRTYDPVTRAWKSLDKRVLTPVREALKDISETVREN